MKKKSEKVKSQQKRRKILLAMSKIMFEVITLICTDFDKEKKHDLKLFKELFKEIRTYIYNDIQLIADKGYQGIKKLHKNSKTPDKKPRGGELTKEQKQSNRILAKERIAIEHTFRKLKIFRI